MYRRQRFFALPDALILALVLALSIWGFLAFRMEAGASIRVFLGNKKFGWYRIDGPPRQVEIPSRIGPVVLEVGGGMAKIISSPCRNKVCVRTGSIRNAHSEIICMPAQMLVIMEGKAGGMGSGKPGSGPSGQPERADGTDAVTY
jgi:hypothetical protein